MSNFKSENKNVALDSKRALEVETRLLIDTRAEVPIPKQRGRVFSNTTETPG